MEPKRLLGLFLLILGVLFGARSMDLLPERFVELIFRWELILIGLGIYFMASERKGSTGLILFLIGLLFWIPDAFELPEDINVWPILLLLAGGYLLFRGGRKSPKVPFPQGSEKRKEQLRETVIFGKSDRIIRTERFRGGDILVLFGEARIDLTRCKWEDGDREIEVFFLFGSGTLHIPPEWELDIQVVPIFGSFRDRRAQHLESEKGAGTRIRITGFSIFGDGRIRD